MLIPIVEPDTLSTTRLTCCCGWSGPAAATLLGDTTPQGTERWCPGCADRTVALVPHPTARGAPTRARTGTPCGAGF